MRAQLQLGGRLYDAVISYHPTETGGEIALTAVMSPPYPPKGEYSLQVYLDGHYVQSTTVAMDDNIPDHEWVDLRQRLELTFNSVPQGAA